mmetsp:Transcript_14995/g.32729  ORF Transcript_14995/g.32729 Transcript_14995/m.32729 type:complete len:254 (-) Transcript_14995:2000-2761(-)
MTSLRHCLIKYSSLQNTSEIKWLESVSIGLEKLVLELHPVKTKGVQEALQKIHTQQHSKRYSCESCVTKVNHDRVVGVNHAQHCLAPKHSGELRVSQGKSPQTQVGSSVRNHTKNKLDCFDGLMNKNLSKVELAISVAVISSTAVTVTPPSSLRARVRSSLGVQQGVGGAVGTHFHRLVGELQVQGLDKEQPRHAHEGHEQEECLYPRLSLVHGLIHRAGNESDVDKSGDEVGWLASVAGTSIIKRAKINNFS